MAHDYDPASPTLEIEGNNAAKQLSFDNENFMKPEKVKSRWRRNSEMETQETNSDEPMPSTLKCISDNKDECPNSKDSPSYEVLEENLYLFERKRTKRKKEVRRMLCECSLKPEDEVGCEDECLNRLLMIECGSRCATGQACSNKRFQKRLYVKTEPFRTEKKGFGLKVLEDVSRGSFVIEYMGEVLNSTQFKERVKLCARDKQKHYYFMALKIDEIIDASRKGNASRFINHSCDPNLETQKWTVNGELRIGFFAKRDIKAEEELTFDYKLERYGRQAQKCYCGSQKCKGYIGASDEATLDIDTNKKEGKNNRRKKYKDKEEKEKRREVLEDLMLEEEIEKLCVNGLRNKDETLKLARLMVRAEDSHSREKLLNIILSTTEVACLRLFLDYHGLTLIWSWMAYLTDNNLKMKILKVLSLLPVPNKTLLLDSKVLNVVEMWASSYNEKKIETIDSVGDKKRGKHEYTKAKSCDTSDSETDVFASRTSKHFAFSSDKLLNCDVTMSEITTLPENTDNNSISDILEGSDSEEPNSDNKRSDASTRSDEESGDALDEKNSESHARIANLAEELLMSWKDLKEVFRIPRREKKEEDEKRVDEQTSSKEEDIYIKKMKNESTKQESNDEKSSFEANLQKIKVVLPFQRKYVNSAPSRKIREERRALFADKMEQREKRKHASHNKNRHYHYPSSHSDYANNENYEYDASGRSNIHHYIQPHENTHNLYLHNTSRPALLPTPGAPPPIICPSAHQQVDSTPVFSNVLYPQPATENFKVPFFSLPPPAIPSVTPDSNSFAITHQASNLAPHLINICPVVSSPIVPMQIRGSSDPISHTSGYNNIPGEFLYEEKPVLNTLEPVFPIPEVPEQTYPIIHENGESNKMLSPLQTKVTPVKLPPNWKTASDSEGNIYYYHVLTRQTQWDPPGVEEIAFDNGTPTYDEPKEHKRETHSRRSHKKHSKRKSTTTAPADSSKSSENGEISKKIKELFRTKMSTYVISCLNPYRKEDSKVGRITSNEDFKHLARKLTHFVMAKELKHCKNVEDLEVNDSVKLKAKDYIRKYMDRYGPVYRKEKSVLLGDD